MTKAEVLFRITQCLFILYLQHKCFYYDSIGKGIFCLFMQVPVNTQQTFRNEGMGSSYLMQAG